MNGHNGRGYALYGGKYTGQGGLFGTVNKTGIVENLAFIGTDFSPASGQSAGIAQKFYGRLEKLYFFEREAATSAFALD
ncbi:MAG: hypothetical protein LBH24_01515 [Clostridiales bacterium]|jgi:hypothetical protein|nr:hypothetical protein [Clostridiales bacterium]